MVELHLHSSIRPHGIVLNIGFYLPEALNCELASHFLPLGHIRPSYRSYPTLALDGHILKVKRN
jgi:hypothetical protein